MISRKTASQLADVYVHLFAKSVRGHSHTTRYVNNARLYDFLYENDFPSWFCNASKVLSYERELKEWLMRLHTGESLVSFAREISVGQLEHLGQSLLEKLACDYLKSVDARKTDLYFYRGQEASLTLLKRRLELDGYVYFDGNLVQQQQDVLNVEEEKNILKLLYQQTNLDRHSDAIHFLDLTEEHFIAGRWSDSISNSRKFLELALAEGARALVMKRKLDENSCDFSKPFSVRDLYLSQQVLVEHEKDALRYFYALLSHTGAHPYMAESDQARLMRQLSLTLAQFVLLRLQSALSEH
jgi:hypothetical protein